MTNPRVSQSHICKQCQRIFHPFRASKGIYCSNQCKFLARTMDKTKTCRGCNRLFQAKKSSLQYCSNPCYQTAKKQRDPLTRLMPFIQKTESCWLWIGGCTSAGYGRIFFHDEFLLAHRLMYQTVTGEDITNKVIRHNCDNPPCVNPDHLISGTMADNTADMVRRKRHKYGEKASNAKLTEVEVLAIRRDPRIHREIARDYDIGRRHVGQIKAKEIWKHLS